MSAFLIRFYGSNWEEWMVLSRRCVGSPFDFDPATFLITRFLPLNHKISRSNVLGGFKLRGSNHWDIVYRSVRVSKRPDAMLLRYINSKVAISTIIRRLSTSICWTRPGEVSADPIYETSPGPRSCPAKVKSVTWPPWPIRGKSEHAEVRPHLKKSC
jgi:hypothetical protein